MYARIDFFFRPVRRNEKNESYPPQFQRVTVTPVRRNVNGANSS